MTDTLLPFVIFWAIWLLIPMLVDGSTAVAYLIGALKVGLREQRRRERFKLTFFPVVTIIIPVHNGAPYLPNCLRAIRQQHYPQAQIEVIVVDNLSTDGTFEIFATEQQKPFGGTLSWISIPQRGKAWALNAGIHLARGTIVMNVDCDTIMHPDAIHNMVRAFEFDPNLAAATGSVEVLPLDPSVVNPVRHLLANCEFQEYYAGFRIGRQYQSTTNSLFTLAGAFSAFRRDVLLRTFMYDKLTVSEDTNLTFEIHRRFAQLQIACIAEAIVYVEPTPSVRDLYAQRVRWQRGQLEVTSLYPEFERSPFRLRGVSSAKSLIVDHTVAFPRVVWTFLLPMLYFVGYPLPLVVTATIALYVCYAVIEGVYSVTCYILGESHVKERIKDNWWLFLLLPVYRFTTFWSRFNGFLVVLTEPGEWRVRDPFAEVQLGMERIRVGLVALVARITNFASVR